MSMKLRDLIRKVRQCKTAAEERAVIAKESAMIRTAIREEQVHYRHRNVAKLLFMHMLGYPTHFGQLECMKLTASPHFPEKRIGYLGMLLLLSEEAEVLMLATNALKSDLASDNKFVAGLALCAIGNLATADMSRDLAPEVDKHLKSPLAYLRKKACLAMARCLFKCPDMVEDFADRVAGLLKDKNHGVLVTVVQLMTQVLQIDYQNALHDEDIDDPLDTECRRTFLKLVPTLVKLLRNLSGSSPAAGYGMEDDAGITGGGSGAPNGGGGGGVNDPFLQVQLLTLLRLLGTGNAQASEEMNDVLAQVATNTETSKNAGNAILYECVQTIMGVVAEDGLRVLAINILGRFLLNRDNNIRYVALNTLAKCIVEQQQQQQQQKNDSAGFVNVDISSTSSSPVNNAMSALQRHRTTVVECLKDPDVSIRQRALELIYHLVNADNVQNLVAELLGYLVLCPREHRADICTRILKVVDRFGDGPGPGPSSLAVWRVDTLITTLTIAGREANMAVQSATCHYISRGTTDIHALATHKLVKAIRDDDGSQKGLLAVGIWCIGEYGDLLLQPYTYTPPSSGGATAAAAAAAVNEGSSITFMQLDPITVVNTIEQVCRRRSCPDYVKERALTAYAKLSRRFANADADASAANTTAALQKLEMLLKNQGNSRSLELQLRACEYNALVTAAKGIKPPKLVANQQPLAAATTTGSNNNNNNNSLEADLFGDGPGTTTNTTTPLENGAAAAAAASGDGPLSEAVIAAAKDALARMPVVDVRILQKRMSTDEFSSHGGGGGSSSSTSNGGGSERGGVAAAPKRTVSTAVASTTGGDLLDLQDMFGAPATTATAPTATTGYGGALPSSGASATVADDMELLADIFAAPDTSSTTTTRTTTTNHATATLSSTVDIFGATPVTAPAMASTADLFGGTAPAASVKTMNLFGGGGASAVTTTTTTSHSDIFGGAPAAAAAASVNPMDLFGAPSSTTPAPAMVRGTTTMNMFGGGGGATSIPTAGGGGGGNTTTPNVFAGPPITATPAAVAVKVRVPAIEKAGLKVEFECSKPDTWNKQKSLLVAHFINTTGDAVYGVNLQVAVPKHVTMEMQPPSSTTVPMGAGKVTQNVTVTNTMLGTKNLALKIKLGFTSKGQKIEHMATCSGFPAGQY